MSKPPWLGPAPLVLAVAIAVSVTGAARAQESEPETILPACGIRYPGGYDPNTVGVVEGRVASADHPERGPVSFRLEVAGDTYTIFAAPAWYLADLKIKIGRGDRVRVKGSKTMGADGILYLVAQEITLPGAEQPVVLRDRLGKPAWAGCGSKGCGNHGR